MSAMELFTAAATTLPGTVSKIGSYLLFIVGGILIFTFVYSFGAAKLSYAYNTSVGNSMAFVWAMLAFFFSGLYYPYYAFFVNPVGVSAISSILPTVGGRRRK
jgi:ABC-type uncharacterized transport system permease subunit